jgi:hypothetical protein
MQPYAAMQNIDMLARHDRPKVMDSLDIVLAT